jgi:transglutaminase-like putative cysteine protease
LVTAGSPGGRLEEVRQLSQIALKFLRWLPFVLYPLVLAHAWSPAGALPWSTFSLYQQTRARRHPELPAPAWSTRRVHPGGLYLVLTLFASTAATTHPQTYLVGFLGVLGLALWPSRNRRFRAPSWVVLWVGVAGLSWIVQQGLVAVREAWQALENRLLQQAAGGEFDPTRSFTALGAVGRLKQSGRVILRVRTHDDRPPGLLREAAFTRFRAAAWSSSHREFQPVNPETDGTVWRLGPGRRDGRALTVARYTAGGEAPLALPSDPVTVHDLPALAVETNQLGAARVRGALPLLQYRVEQGRSAGRGRDAPPEAEDRDLDHLSPADAAAIRETAAALGLEGLDPAAAVAAVERHFAAGFQYSLWQGRLPAGTNTSPLAVFLRQTHAGHCEFFATATVLLLRTAGVPTRYVVGFSPEPHGDEWWARGRDAHAWCLAYLGDSWQEIDTTPGVWRDREAATAGWWEFVGDRASELWYRFTLWRQQGGNWQVVVFSVGMAILAWLAWRQLRGSRWRRSRSPATAATGTILRTGLDSEFFAVVKRLESLHGPRPPHEPLPAWLERVVPEATRADAPLREALGLHNRLRFDPLGLAAGERARLRQLVVDWVSHHATLLRGG